MDLELVGKRALVTGSSSGIGAEIARMLAAEGVAVVVHGRDRAQTQAVATGHDKGLAYDFVRSEAWPLGLVSHALTLANRPAQDPALLKNLIKS